MKCNRRELHFVLCGGSPGLVCGDRHVVVSSDLWISLCVVVVNKSDCRRDRVVHVSCFGLGEDL